MPKIKTETHIVSNYDNFTVETDTSSGSTAIRGRIVTTRVAAGEAQPGLHDLNRRLRGRARSSDSETSSGSRGR